jgi:hypothetical protein
MLILAIVSGEGALRFPSCSAASVIEFRRLLFDGRRTNC